MTLKRSYAKKEDIPEGFDALYTEKDGKWVLNKIEGLVGNEEVERVQNSLESEREAHRQTKDKLNAFGDRKPEDVASAYDELEVLRAKHSGKDDSVETQVQARVNQELGPMKREKEKLEKERGEAENRAKTAQDLLRRTLVRGAISAAAIEAKVEPMAIPDIILNAERIFEIPDSELARIEAGEEPRVVTKDKVGVTPGIDATAWLSDVNDSGKKAHWWPRPGGGGATGNDGKPGAKNNPWKQDTFNLTEQGRITRDNPDLAKKLKAEAGIQD